MREWIHVYLSWANAAQSIPYGEDTKTGMTFRLYVDSETFNAMVEYVLREQAQHLRWSEGIEYNGECLWYDSTSNGALEIWPTSDVIEYKEVQ